MKLTTRSQYAFLALIHLARHEADGLQSVMSIANAQQIPAKYLEQILLTLKRARYLKSAKGQQGGYQLAQSPENISLAEIIRLFDGSLAPVDSASKHFYEPTPIEREGKISGIFKEVRNSVAKILEKKTLRDII
jgi:Rrf2 family protein